jgi:hypothetical protein
VANERLGIQISNKGPGRPKKVETQIITSFHTDLGGCPRIAIFSQIEAFGKFYRRHIVDIPRI